MKLEERLSVWSRSRCRTSSLHFALTMLTTEMKRKELMSFLQYQCNNTNWKRFERAVSKIVRCATERLG